MIYHVVRHEQWEAAKAEGIYKAGSLEKEGFIHASTGRQVRGVVERYYKGESGLLILHIDESRLTSPLKYELSASVNEEFPHIYGPLNIDAVIKAAPL